MINITRLKYTASITIDLLSSALVSTGIFKFSVSSAPINIIDVALEAGRLAEQKGFETLLLAFDRVTEKNENARLLIVGTGSQEPQLRALLSELGVECAYMNAADVFVLSSKWERFGIVLVEAMALGTPVVTTDCPPGPSEMVSIKSLSTLVT